MRRNVQLKRSPMKPRSTPMPRGTKPLFSGALSGRFSAAGEVPPNRQVEAVAARRTVRRETGFTAKDKLLIRTRAGNGDPDQARCEATGVWLGAHGGEYQHIRARGMGGSRLRNNVANGVLLSPEAHRLAESRDEHMHAMGFWLLSSDPPSPIMLHGLQGGILVWLDDAGHYLDASGRVIGGAP